MEDGIDHSGVVTTREALQLLDDVQLGKVTQQVAMAIAARQYCCMNKRSVKNLLVKTIEQKRISPNRLSAGLRKEVLGKGLPPEPAV